jgi:hypothetical protein
MKKLKKQQKLLIKQNNLLSLLVAGLNIQLNIKKLLNLLNY